MPDEGEGEKKIWRIEDMELVEVPDDQKNYLYDGDCYVILYSGDKTKIVYFWQGSKCSIDERGASAIHAARIDNENLGGLAIQVLKYSLWKGSFIIINSSYYHRPPKIRIFQISTCNFLQSGIIDDKKK